jgi:hypothetical protein
MILPEEPCWWAVAPRTPLAVAHSTSKNMDSPKVMLQQLSSKARGYLNTDRFEGSSQGKQIHGKMADAYHSGTRNFRKIHTQSFKGK